MIEIGNWETEEETLQLSHIQKVSMALGGGKALGLSALRMNKNRGGGQCVVQPS